MIDILRGSAAVLRWQSALLFLVGLPALLLTACTPRQTHIPEPSQIPFGQGRVWQVEGPGLETSYVFATFDRRDKRTLVLPGPAEAAFETSEVVAFDALLDPYIQAELFEA